MPPQQKLDRNEQRTRGDEGRGGRRPLALASGLALAATTVLGTGLASAQEDEQDLPYERGIAAACTAAAQSSDPPAFPDIADTPHRAAIECLARWEVVKGRDAGDGERRYAPGGRVDRAAMASYVARALAPGTYEFPPREDGDPDAFPDIVDVHVPNINALADAGIVEGYPDGNYHQTRSVPRGQMASYVARAIETVTGTELPSAPGTFPDEVPVHQENIDKLAAIGVVQGREDGTYDPQGVVTRAAMASYIARSLDYLAVLGLHPVPYEVELSAESDEQPANLRHRFDGQVLDQFGRGYFQADVRFEVHRETADGYQVVNSGEIVSGLGGELDFSYLGEAQAGDVDHVAACTVGANEDFEPDATACAAENDDGELEGHDDRGTTIVTVGWTEPVEPSVAEPDEYMVEAIAVDTSAGLLYVQTITPDRDFLEFGYDVNNDFQVEGQDTDAYVFGCAVEATLDAGAQHSMSILLEDDGTGSYALATAADVDACW
ncbi:S-layer homology domain-containing protein [Egicoccus sp. AB-alg2]|uniref:S-layer homology domain-containing protein n=1 Tax=Egicoccus sp. AB-alg2 TaxID=3242693 RepID=UPI00359E544D